MTADREASIYRVTLIGTALNAVLIGLKFFAGIVGRSSAMVADAAHSLSDFVTDVIVLVFVKIAGKPRDDSHDYGHGKYETLATLIIGFILALAGIALGVNGGHLVYESLNGEVLPRPGMIALLIAIVSIVSKEWLYRYTKRVGEEVKSNAVIANAWHHRSDAISSIGTLIGIGGAMFLGQRWRILDPLAAMVVSYFIVKAGVDIMRPCVNELLEGSLPPDEEQEIIDVIVDIPGIYSMHNLRTRRIGNNIAIDCHVQMDGNISLTQAHNIASEAEQRLKNIFGKGTHISLHMEPFKGSILSDNNNKADDRK